MKCASGVLFNNTCFCPLQYQGELCNRYEDPFFDLAFHVFFVWIISAFVVHFCG